MQTTDRQYREALAYIQGFTNYEHIAGAALASASFDLRRTYGLLRQLGDPQSRFRCVVIAGTKGKGSTASMIDSILRTGGLRVGFYSQPHLHTYRERIRVNGAIISKGALAAETQVVMQAVEAQQREQPELGPPTTYEVGTALAFQHFARERIDVAVLEVGMGGRLDAVNVVNPAVAVITAISLDHTAVLGDTVQLIAREKGGIIKPGSKVVVAPQWDEALEEILEICRERRAEPFFVQQCRWSHVRGGIFDSDGGLRGQVMDLEGPFGEYKELHVPLLGPHQLVNAATAVSTCYLLCGGSQATEMCVDETAVRQGLSAVKWPGRFEVAAEAPFVILDGAHNRDSAQRLVVALRQAFPGKRYSLIIGTSVDKDIDGIAAALSELTGTIWLTRSRHPRAAGISILAEAFACYSVETRATEDVAEALQAARREAGKDDVICVTGSLFVVAEAREALGLADEVD